MPLTKLQFKPGINREITSYSNEGGWRDCDKIRFRFGYPEKIGGWEKYSSNTYLGAARALHNWIGLDGSNYLGVGTHLKYYIEEGETFNDITPLSSTTAAGAVTFAATNGSNIITVTDVNHGAGQDDFVTFSGAVTLGGNITAAILNTQHQVTSIISGSQYQITVSATANASDTGNGGAAVVGAYQINVGLNTAVGGTGWGAGVFGGTTTTAAATTVNMGAGLSATATTITATSTTGFPSSGYIKINAEIIQYTGISGNDFTGCIRGTISTTATTHANGDTIDDATHGWGMPSPSTTTTEIRLWSHDNFGENLLINPRDGAIYYWVKNTGTTSRAVEIGTLAGANETPIVAKQVLVSDQDRHVIAFGCNPQGGTVQDPLLIRFSDQESEVEWEARVDTTAGDLRLGAGSTFVQAVETKREVLVWTDTSLSSLRYIGPPFTFGLQQLASNITIAGPHAAVATEDFVFWMGIDNFYIYAGQTQQLPCTVKDKVFLDFNTGQADKVFAGINSEYGEVFWFYPSDSNSLQNGGDGENDRYVVYNYIEKLWYFGTLRRTAWLDRGTRSFPIAAEGGYLYNHEFGYDADGSAMNSFIESAAIDMQDGESFTYVRRLIPDMTFDGSTALSSPQATFTVKARDFPGQSFDNTASQAAIRTSTNPVEEYTNQLYLRARGRSFALRVESNALGTKWKLGSPRVDVRPDGRR